MTEQGNSRARAFRIVGGAVLAVSAVGFFAEMRRPPPAHVGYAEGQDSLPLAASARSYSELREGAPDAMRELYLAEAATLAAQLPSVLEPFEREQGDREEALALRAKGRAFEGAPPTVPHPVDQRAVPNCIVCHERGAKVGERIAPAMSHAAFSSCQQCHVEAKPAAFALQVPPPEGSMTDARSADSQFETLSFGGSGSRAWAGAPPTMPHSVWMRQRCNSCHGVTAHPGLRTSHPERQSCRQCHAPTAALDQSLLGFGPALKEVAR